MKRIRTILIAAFTLCVICCAYILTDMHSTVCKIYVQEFLENETYNTITLETGLIKDADIVREYFQNKSYYDQVTWEINYN